MKCPICQVDLMMTERQGIEIDYCPKCRGVWLDRGELDKITEKYLNEANQASREYLKENKDQERKFHNERYEEHGKKDSAYHADNDYHHRKHKKKGLLKDLFDF
ncbi:MAG: hypothetical protein UR60_C0006G0037 [Candidatus Moranbacteria bacterium GW2011_GWF2_34_56]|nr:MAG: hypothetical protein UR51_C0005G0041 [Candidatus Moranbacteria bacterium GW2011_GWF1_34_10]KKP65215.1 MAG: hypothetical protein UR60_C0006G0037 [Candidatus Moranbacteria bacterium GW2011_GWF2_34_56]HBI17667.1 hypothetical protein [Candidatus Moranbacteria bacterium]